MDTQCPTSYPTRNKVILKQQQAKVGTMLYAGGMYPNTNCQNMTMDQPSLHDELTPMLLHANHTPDQIKQIQQAPPAKTKSSRQGFPPTLTSGPYHKLLQQQLNQSYYQLDFNRHKTLHPNGQFYVYKTMHYKG